MLLAFRIRRSWSPSWRTNYCIDPTTTKIGFDEYCPKDQILTKITEQAGSSKCVHKDSFYTGTPNTFSSTPMKMLLAIKHPADPIRRCEVPWSIFVGQAVANDSEIVVSAMQPNARSIILKRSCSYVENSSTQSRYRHLIYGTTLNDLGLNFALPIIKYLFPAKRMIGWWTPWNLGRDHGSTDTALFVYFQPTTIADSVKEQRCWVEVNESRYFGVKIQGNHETMEEAHLSSFR